MSKRIADMFARVRGQRRAALVTFVMGGDPDMQTFLDILRALPRSGADLIEIGMPFTDPMADGPSIQAAGLRARAGGATVTELLNMVREFRRRDDTTPVVLMGYYNPIYVRGPDRLACDAAAAGVDGFIVVDLPPEEDEEFRGPAAEAGLDVIRLASPTTDDARLPIVLQNASGFIYYVSITGITGAAIPDYGKVSEAVERLKRHTDLPVAVGFGVKTRENAAAIAQRADAVVVGTAIVDALRNSLDSDGSGGPQTVEAISLLVAELASGVRGSRRDAQEGETR